MVGSIAALASGVGLKWPRQASAGGVVGVGGEWGTAESVWRPTVHIDQVEPFDLGPGRFAHVILHSDSRLRLVGDCTIDRLDVMGRGEVDLRSPGKTMIRTYNAIGGYLGVIPDGWDGECKSWISLRND